MLNADEDAVICDLAETYGILDYRAIDPMLAATLAAGLSPDSRIKRAMSVAGADTETLFMAAMLDRLSFIAWAQTEDGAHGRNRPESVLKAITGRREETPFKSFASGTDFDAEWQRLTKRGDTDV